jgi:hypothetical protein
MTVQKTMVAAAIAGVVSYLESERGTAEPMPELTQPTVEKGVQASVAGGSLWAASGRLQIMQIRNLMQFRVFRKL